MSLKDKLFESFKKKNTQQENTNTKYTKEQIKALVYDDELVEELEPIFNALFANEGFAKVVELLEAKEQQLEAISTGSFKKQSSDEGNEQEEKGMHNDGSEGDGDSTQADLVDAILAGRYK